jgi:hypothetical protein
MNGFGIGVRADLHQLVVIDEGRRIIAGNRRAVGDELKTKEVFGSTPATVPDGGASRQSIPFSTHKYL